MSERRLVVVDLESSGLADRDIPVEIGWHDVDTGDHAVFIPEHDEQWVLEHGHPNALEINGYRERILGQPQDVGDVELTRLHHQLRGQVLVGANPRFDANVLVRRFRQAGLHPEPWHHRIADVEVYACGVLRISLRTIPGLSDIAHRLGIPGGDHTAGGDVATTVAVLRALISSNEQREAA